MADNRICSKCGCAKPATIDFFQLYKTPLGLNHLRYVCRICRGCKSEGLYRRTRKLGKSDEEKIESNKQWCSKYYSKNKKRQNEYYKKQRSLNPEKIRNRDRQYYLKNKANKEYQKHRWQLRKNHPETLMATSSRSRAKTFGASGIYTKEDIKKLIQYQNKTCFYCSIELEKFHVDHFIPLSRGGSNGPENVVLSCARCNCSKGGKMPWEWMPQIFSIGQCHG